MSDIYVPDVIRRIEKATGEKAVTLDQAIVYQEMEIMAKNEHIRVLEKRVQRDEEKEHIIDRLSVQNENYRAEIDILNKQIRDYKKKLETDDRHETVIRVNRSDIDNVEIYFKG